MYTVTQAARSANVSTTSIRNWAKLYADFLSPSANPPAGTPREFTAADLGAAVGAGYLQDCPKKGGQSAAVEAAD